MSNCLCAFKGDTDCVHKKAERRSQGWKDGRSGKKPQQSDQAYMEGWHDGEIALEECENGHDPRFDG